MHAAVLLIKNEDANKMCFQADAFSKATVSTRGQGEHLLNVVIASELSFQAH